ITSIIFGCIFIHSLLVVSEDRCEKQCEEVSASPVLADRVICPVSLTHHLRGLCRCSYCVYLFFYIHHERQRLSKLVVQGRCQHLGACKGAAAIRHIINRLPDHVFGNGWITDGMHMRSSCERCYVLFVLRFRAECGNPTHPTLGA